VLEISDPGTTLAFESEKEFLQKQAEHESLPTSPETLVSLIYSNRIATPRSPGTTNIKLFSRFSLRRFTKKPKNVTKLWFVEVHICNATSKDGLGTPTET
jgi:hypothetical protein